MTSRSFTITRHDTLPPEAGVVDHGLDVANHQAAASLSEVQPLSVFARDDAGAVLGGALGRRWAQCCELQQLWVDPDHRRRGIGTKLVREFEEHARECGCKSFFLETFSFQAPSLYLALGYKVAYTHGGYPKDVLKYFMTKDVEGLEG
jgi:ribosomal protein S18 acetylase RimI-like enzyme